MEPRWLLSGTAFGVSGPAAVDEGSPYVLGLSAAGPGAATVDHWTINWGDGVTDTLAGSPASASHVYADGAAQHTILATATNAEGTFPARNGAAANDGDLDAGFAAGGKLVVTAGGFKAGTAVAVQPDGKLPVVGNVSSGDAPDSRGSDFGLARYNSDGTLDATFGAYGVVRTDFSNRMDRPTKVAVQADGKILVAGQSLWGGGGGYAWNDSDFALARYNADGSLANGDAADATPRDSFGAGGKVIKHVGPYRHSVLTGLAVQPDGKIVASGTTRRRT